jgi:acetylglutamate kinase
MKQNPLADAPGFTTARTLSEALPYIQRYDRQTVVIKYGGHAMVDAELSRLFAKDVVLLKQLGLNPVVVHGGGPQIGRMLDRLGIISKFEDGLRVTDGATMEVVEMVLAGAINKSIVRGINAAGGKGVGLSGADANLLTAQPAKRTRRDPGSEVEQVIDLGFVGEPDSVHPAVIETLMAAEADFIPVIAPVGLGPDGEHYNINADTAAGAIAGALHASRVLFLTDVQGVLDKSGELLREIRRGEIDGLITNRTVSGGMIPKLENARRAVDEGAGASVILDGRSPHAILTELFTEHGSGTLIR